MSETVTRLQHSLYDQKAAFLLTDAQLNSYPKSSNFPTDWMESCCVMQKA
ncbi:hypothetical protein [Paenibacillus pini]|nr:hypothetical protein [Paenibacillus pini]